MDYKSNYITKYNIAATDNRYVLLRWKIESILIIELRQSEASRLAALSIALQGGWGPPPIENGYFNISPCICY
jgi:hypothetical protein